MATAIKKITPRAKKEEPVLAENQLATPTSNKLTPNTIQLSGLADQIEQLKQLLISAKDQVLSWQKTLDESAAETDKTKVSQKQALEDEAEQEKLRQNREKEEFAYTFARDKQQAKDAFDQEKIVWKRQLEEEKQVIANERKELAELRTKVAGFEADLTKAIKETQTKTTIELETKHQAEKKLTDQEVASEMNLSALKIEGLEKEVERQAAEITTLRKSLEDASRQLKDVALKVIESHSSATPLSS